MKKNKIILFALVVILFAAGIIIKETLFVSGVWRYKMTVTVETPEGIKTGSAVREVSNSASKIKIINFPESVNPAEVKGEAVVVDLGNRGKLFALLRGYKLGEGHAEDILYYSFGGGTSVERIQALNNIYKNNIGKKVTLEPSDYPVLVMFKDNKDPKSVLPVLEMEPEKIPDQLDSFKIKVDRFDELFGKGVRLKNIAIELTEEPITNVVDKYIPSFEGETKFWEWLRTLDYGDQRLITPADFK